MKKLPFPKKKVRRRSWAAACRPAPLSDLVAGRIQAGPQSTPPRRGPELERWQDPDLFHSPEL